MPEGTVEGEAAPPQNPATTAEEDENSPEKFDANIEYWLSCIGFAVGYGNLWRFPYMLFENGGAVFLIPYLLSLGIIGVPMYYMETAYGQLVSCKLHQRYAIIAPKAWGFILLQFFICFFTCVFYVSLMAWSFIYFFESFKSPLPWTVKKEGQSVGAVWNPDFLYEDVLGMSTSITDTNRFVGYVTLCMFFSYVVLYFCVFKGLKSTGKFVYVSCLGPYFILLILMIRGFTLDGMGKGLKFLFKPDFSKLWSPKLWKDAGVQILFSIGVTFGPLMYYGSARYKNERILPVSYGVPLANSGTSFYAALTVFPFLGHISTVKNLPIEQVSGASLDLVFVGFPGLLNEIPGSNFWAVIFYFMMLCLGVDSAFGFLDFFIQMLTDMFPVKKYMRKEAFAGITCLFCFCWSLIFCLDSGYYWFDLFDQYSIYLGLYIAILAEVKLIAYDFGIERLGVLMKHTTGEKPQRWMEIFCKYIIPLFTILLMVLLFIDEFGKDGRVRGNYDQEDIDAGRKKIDWPVGILWLGRFMTIFECSWILIGLCFTIEAENIHDIIKKNSKINLDDEAFVSQQILEMKTMGKPQQTEQQ